MLRFNRLMGRLGRDTRGATAIEYSLIAALIAVAIIGALTALGTGNSSSWGNTTAKITGAMQGN
jgi:pilus assembly protein Flp/PilA